jgi:putative FmdB family regulatory protein
MPTYEYECKKCRHAFEQFQRMSDEPLKRCPKCKGALRRLMGTGAGIIFKGSGFYQTDYRSESYRKGAKADTGPSSAATTPAPSTPAKKAD